MKSQQEIKELECHNRDISEENRKFRIEINKKDVEIREFNQTIKTLESSTGQWKNDVNSLNNTLSKILDILATTATRDAKAQILESFFCNRIKQIRDSKKQNKYIAPSYGIGNGYGF